MKPYPSHMREKRRYIVFELMAEGKPDRKSVVRALWDSVFENIGAFGAAESAFWVVDYDERKMRGIVRSTNKALDSVIACLALLSKVKNKKAFIHIIGGRGTIKKASS